MTATTEGRNTKRRTGDKLSVVPNSGAVIYAGTLVTLLTATGLAVPGGTASAGPVVGVATEPITGDGVKATDLEKGIFKFANSAAADLIAKADIGATCYVVDNQTVAKTDNSAARKAAGKIIDVDADGVWVEVG
ncbi:MAG: hypothetical protein FH747_13865 [Stenotrophomonas sp.]|uniref:hypothetical protein n=1 Tax=Stenotrophomonas sp. TaxID=69392 RepID=UPI0013527A46|nr:hypothetical protein [Stenotrophomonas sp.]MTI74721.1 hypothetical protein [Stenotrophomonas sp.]